MMAKVLPDASIVRCKACDGSGVVPRTYETELDRLRAEKAELVMALEDLLNLKQGCHERADAILAKTNETETDAQEALPTAAEVRGILK
jgi:hypothetical protein